MTEHDLRQRVCDQAKSWLGRNEMDGSHREIIDVYNRGRPPGSYKMTYTDPWCAAFVSAVGMACGLEGIILPSVGCDDMIAKYRAVGHWIEADDYPAQPGDLIFYDWQDSGAGDNQGSSDHVGLVVDVDGNLFTVIEGNYSDAVKRRYVYRDAQSIRGFAAPDYAWEAALETAVEPGTATVSTPDTTATVVTDTNVGDKPEPATTCAPVLPILREGDESEAVRSAQRLLIARGFPCGGSWSGRYLRELPDGEFGPKTKSSVLAFQDQQDLPETGEIDGATWVALITT